MVSSPTNRNDLKRQMLIHVSGRLEEREEEHLPTSEGLAHGHARGVG